MKSYQTIACRQHGAGQCVQVTEQRPAILGSSALRSAWMSLALRAGVKVDAIIEQLKGIGGEHPVFQKGGLVLSIPDAISRVLEKRYHDTVRENGPQQSALIGEKCPECSQTISFEEGCMTCHFCGYTKCG